MRNLHTSAPPQRMDSETISISIGNGSDTRASSSIVLPRGHELIRHLELLLPQIVQAGGAAQPSPPSPQHAHHSRHHSHHLSHHHDDRKNSGFAPAHHHHYDNAPLRRHVMDQRHHPYTTSASVRPTHALPQSPYQSDSSRSSSSNGSGASSYLSFEDTPHTTQSIGMRRRRGTAGQAVGKKCQFPSCEKISVSRGLCRGHGGGRRCQHGGCSKGAQSRSDYCWAHGGGQRCEVRNCMRSRKSKRFCVAHLSWENVPPGDSQLLDAASTPLPPPPSTNVRLYETPKPIMPKPAAAGLFADIHARASSSSSHSSFQSFAPLTSSLAKLPSLQQALQQNHQSVSVATGRPKFVHEHFPHHRHHAAAVLNSASG